MLKHIAALVFIFICTTIAWIILGTATNIRAHTQDTSLKKAVRQLWGTVQRQQAPYVYYQTKEEIKVRTNSGAETTEETKTVTTDHPIILGGSDITVKLMLDHRKKGLLWYSTYRVMFSGKYLVVNDSKEGRDIFFKYTFPAEGGIYDNFSLVVDKEKIKDFQPTDGKIVEKLRLAPGEEKRVEIAYDSQGMDEWWYLFGSGVSQIRNFKLSIVTDFSDIDFPENSISPTRKQEKDNGWELTWEYSNLVSGIQIGMDMPQKLNPGPFVGKVTFFAPVSLFLFLFLMFIITAIRKIDIHPMNYFFISAAFFSFHLLLAYLVDHVNIHAAFLIASLVSIFLVVSYMRLVVGIRFALIETGLSQLVYLILFSYAFFLKGYTGLTVTIGCVLTLFLAMQLTGRIDWSNYTTGQKP